MEKHGPFTALSRWTRRGMTQDTVATWWTLREKTSRTWKGPENGQILLDTCLTVSPLRYILVSAGQWFNLGSNKGSCLLISSNFQTNLEFLVGTLAS